MITIKFFFFFIFIMVPSQSQLYSPTPGVCKFCSRTFRGRSQCSKTQTRFVLVGGRLSLSYFVLREKSL